MQGLQEGDHKCATTIDGTQQLSQDNELRLPAQLTDIQLAERLQVSRDAGKGSPSTRCLVYGTSWARFLLLGVCDRQQGPE